MNSRNTAKIWGILLTISLALFLGSPLARADIVALGTDYLTTQNGTFANLGGSLGMVTFGGVALPGLGTADTIIQRTSDIPIGSTLTLPAVQNLDITALSLVSTNLSTNIYISLDPANLANDVGHMAITGSAANGGLFVASLDVFFDICTAPSPTGVGCGAGTSLGTGNFVLTDPSTGTPWSPNAPNGAVIVPGLDCDSPNCTPAQNAADQAANQHAGLSAGEVDFWPGIVGPGGVLNTGGGTAPPGTKVPIMSCGGGGAECHPVDPAGVPEPASVLLLGSCLLGLAALARNKLLKKS